MKRGTKQRKTQAVGRSAPTACSVSNIPLMWKFIASCVDHYADTLEIHAKFKGIEMNQDERWAHDLARGASRKILEETQKPNPTGQAPARSAAEGR